MFCEHCGRFFIKTRSSNRTQRFCNTHCASASRAGGRDGEDDPKIKDVRLFVPTDAPPGSSEKLAVLARRVEIGAPLFHPNDRIDFSAIRIYQTAYRLPVLLIA